AAPGPGGRFRPAPDQPPAAGAGVPSLPLLAAVAGGAGAGPGEPARGPAGLVGLPVLPRSALHAVHADRPALAPAADRAQADGRRPGAQPSRRAAGVWRRSGRAP